MNLVLGRNDEALRRARRALEMYRQEFGGTSRMVSAVEVQIARITAYQGDFGTAAEFTQRVIAAQAEAKAAGRNDAVFVEGERILLDAVDFFLRGEDDAKFDAMAARALELQLQPPDIVEIMEWKALSAMRAGRRTEGMQFLESALEKAKGTVAFDRVRNRVAAVAAEPTAPKLAGNAP